MACVRRASCRTSPVRLSFITFALALIGSSLAIAQETAVPAAVTRVGDHQYTYGLLKIDGKKREITFPAEINQIEGNVEYAIVHQDGKTHESLIATKVRSTELQVALLLCRYATTSKETAEAKGKLGIWIHWTDADGSKQATPLHNWVYNGLKGEPLQQHLWLFTGVPTAKPGEPPVDDQSLVAIFNDPYAAINCHDPKSANDDLWYPTEQALPAIKTEVMVRIAPLPNDNT